MPIRLRKEDMDGPLARELEELSRARVAECYQCGKCSAGCPVAEWMDIQPTRVMRLAQLGRYEEILSSETIWLCASCVTCTTRCPREVDVAAVMDGLREMALARGQANRRSREITAFHKAFLDTVWAFGRMAEFAMVGDYKLRSGKYFQDVFVAPGMMKKGKLHFLPRRISGTKEIRAIFKKCGL